MVDVLPPMVCDPRNAPGAVPGVPKGCGAVPGALKENMEDAAVEACCCCGCPKENPLVPPAPAPPAPNPNDGGLPPVPPDMIYMTVVMLGIAYDDDDDYR